MQTIPATEYQKAASAYWHQARAIVDNGGSHTLAAKYFRLADGLYKSARIVMGVDQ